MTVTVAGFTTADIHAAAASAGAGGTLEFPNGTYRCEGLTASYTNQTWHLDRRAILKNTATSTKPVLKLTADGFHLRGGTLDGNRRANRNLTAGIDSSGFSFDGREFTLQNVNGWGIGIDNADMTLIDVKITSTLNAGVFWRNTLMETCMGPIIERVTVDRSTEDPARVASGGILIQALLNKWMVTPRIVNCTVTLPPSTAYGAVCIEMLQTITGLIAGNTFSGGRIGISVGGDRESAIERNHGRGQADYAFELSEANGTMINGNDAIGDAPSHWGITCTNASQHVRGTGNILRGFATPIEIGSDCKDCIIR